MELFSKLPALVRTTLSLLLDAIKDASSVVITNLNDLPLIIRDEIVEEVINYYKIDVPVDVPPAQDYLDEEVIYDYSA